MSRMPKKLTAEDLARRDRRSDLTKDKACEIFSEGGCPSNKTEVAELCRVFRRRMEELFEVQINNNEHDGDTGSAGADAPPCQRSRI